MRAGTKATLLGPICAGICVGLGLGSVVSVRPPPPASDPGRLRALEASVVKLTARVAELERPAAAETPPDRSGESLQRHLAEPVNALWADAATSTLGADFARFGGARVTALDCRTSSCLAVLEMRSSDDAAETTRALLGHAFSLNCSTAVDMPEPDDPEAPHRASVLFDCRDGPGSFAVR